MTVSEIRKKYLDFFRERGHTVIPSASLVPENDPTTLFTSSGMQPLVPYLLGEPHPQGSRLADSQKSFRAQDIEEVGDNRHTTFFEMLGNWSLGDYFKQEQLPWFFEYLTNVVGLDPQKLYVTVFMGDAALNIPKDEEAIQIWKRLFAEKGIDAKDVVIGSEANGYEVGMQSGRIFAYDAKKNWWSRSGTPDKMPPGEPGGPDSEVFYDFGTPHDPKWGKECHPNCDCGRFMEIGNSVFMQYVKLEDGSFGKLPKANVDFGGGLERRAAAARNNSDVFLVDTFLPIIRELAAHSGKSYEDPEYQASFRIVADHVRGAVFMLGDGVVPSNTERGYIARRLIRRAVRHLDRLGVGDGMLEKIVDYVIDAFKDHYGELDPRRNTIRGMMRDEEEKFRKTLAQGMKVLDKKMEAFLVPVGGPIPEEKMLKITGTEYPEYTPPRITGEWMFDFYQAYGFPFELLVEELISRNELTQLEIPGLKIGFDRAMQKHQDLSRAGSEQKFKGGLADHSEMSVRYHTATHLLHKALKMVLGPTVQQKGSNITPERLRFDFAFDRKMTDEEKKTVEGLVNAEINRELEVSYQDLPYDDAMKLGAIGLFEEKYGDTVRVYKIGDFSLEFCGGPHVSNTRELAEGGRKFKIQKEEAVAAGIRRIKAVLE